MHFDTSKNLPYNENQGEDRERTVMNSQENHENVEGTFDAPKFDLFATEVEDNLKEELAKGSFQWTDKYTKFFSFLLLATTLVTSGIWYGNHYAKGQVSASGQSLRSAFSGLAGLATGVTPSGAIAGGGSGFGAGAGGGFGGPRVLGTVTAVSGSTVTITLTDPTQTATFKAGDAARITDTSSAGNFPGATSAGSADGATLAGTVSPTVGSSTATPGASINTGAAGSGAAGSGAAGSGAAGSGAAGSGDPAISGPGTGSGGGGQVGGRGGGLFSNPALVMCLAKAGITITAGQRPDFQDPKTQSAMTSCFSELGIAAPGVGGRSGAGGGNGRPRGNGAFAPPTPTASTTP
jgi:hypothetical protein